MPKSRFSWLLLTALLAAGCRRAAPLPLDVGMWYWHSPFSVSDAELKSLRAIGVKTLYVREATFTTDGKRAITEFHEHWQSNPPGIKVVLVYNFDPGVVRHFGAMPNEGLVSDIAAGVEHTVALVKSHGITPAGIQMDLDCPTRLLGKYSELLVGLRQRLVVDRTLTEGQTYSATALQTWLGSDKYANLALACDFLAPQFYESRTGSTIEKVAPIADLETLRSRVEKAGSFGKPFFVGVATYGHALLYNDQGNLAGMYHGMQPGEALRHPALRFDSNLPLNDEGTAATPPTYAGEDLIRFTAVQNDLEGHGRGYHIAYLVPHPEMLRRQLAAIVAARQSNCRGVILFRYPKEGDELAVSLTGVAEAFSGQPSRPALRAEFRHQSVPWELIASPDTRMPAPASFEVTITNTGTEPTMLAADGLTVLVRLDRPGVERVNRGGFDEALAGIFSSDGLFRRCAPAHANSILLRKYELRSGERVRSGVIEAPADGARVATLDWCAKFDGGLSTLRGTAKAQPPPSRSGKEGD